MVSFILAGAASFVSVMGVLRLGHVNWTPSPTLPVINAQALPMICYHYRYSNAAPTKSTPGLFALKEVLGMRANRFLGSERFWAQSYGCLCVCDN